MKPGALIFPFLLLLMGAQSAYGSDKSAGAAANAPVLLQGRFDNREQVTQAAAKAGAENSPMPHVVVVIEPTQQAGWSLWRMHLEADAENSLDATWAMQTRIEGDGSKALIPYYQLKPPAPPAADAFDAQTWLSLEACALRGEFGKSRIRAGADGMPCVVVATGVGPRRILLPVAIEREGDWLRFHLIYLGIDTRVDARRVADTR